MTQLDACRQEIDKLDDSLAALLERRFEIVEEIGRLKSDSGMAVRDNAREGEILDRVSAKLKNPAYKDRVQMILRNVMEASRSLQDSIRCVETTLNIDPVKGARVAYGGIPGSYGESALIKYFGSAAGSMHARDTFAEVCDALQEGSVDYGVLPIENTITGAITEVYDLIRNRNLHIVGETCLPIVHNLIGHKGAKLEDITQVYSHPQGLEQCSAFLDAKGSWQQMPMKNTALGVLHVAESKDKSSAAIGSVRAADLYNLEVLAPAIQNSIVNKTRFLIVSTKMEVSPDANRTSMVLVTRHEAGSLHELLGCFENVNMVRIESRPVPDRPWEYYIYLDAEAGFDDVNFQKALQEVRPMCPYFKLLGSYRKGNDC